MSARRFEEKMANFENVGNKSEACCIFETRASRVLNIRCCAPVCVWGLGWNFFIHSLKKMGARANAPNVTHS